MATVQTLTPAKAPPRALDPRLGAERRRIVAHLRKEAGRRKVSLPGRVLALYEAICSATDTSHGLCLLTRADLASRAAHGAHKPVSEWTVSQHLTRLSELGAIATLEVPRLGRTSQGGARMTYLVAVLKWRPPFTARGWRPCAWSACSEETARILEGRAGRLGPLALTWRNGARSTLERPDKVRARASGRHSALGRVVETQRLNKQEEGAVKSPRPKALRPARNPASGGGMCKKSFERGVWGSWGLPEPPPRPTFNQRGLPRTRPSGVAAKVSGRRPLSDAAGSFGLLSQVVGVLEAMTGEVFDRGPNGSRRKWLRDLLGAWPSDEKALATVTGAALKAVRVAKTASRIGYVLGLLESVVLEHASTGVWPTVEQLVSDDDRRDLERVRVTGTACSPNEVPAALVEASGTVGALMVDGERSDQVGRERLRQRVSVDLMARCERAVNALPARLRGRARDALRIVHDDDGARRFAVACEVQALAG